MKQTTLIFFSLSLILFLGAGCRNTKDTSEETSSEPQVLDYQEEWIEFARAEGDLNNDHRSDIALALKKQDENTKSMATGTRKLVIELQQEDGTYLTNSETNDALMCAGCGGVWGDPFDSIEINSSTLIISHYGGSNFRWTNSYSFALVDGQWLMTDEHATSFNTFDPDTVDKYDWDMGAQQPGETTLEDFDIMLGIL